MKRILVVGPIAEREIEATARWYEAREPGLGEGFIVELCDSGRARTAR